MGMRDCKKIIVIGNAGSGKTQFAKRLAEIMNLPLIHLDKEFWQPGWRETPRELWLEKHKKLIEDDEWIIDGNYSSNLKERFLLADAVLFLDISRPRCYINLLKRYAKNKGQERDDLPEDCPEFLRPDQFRKVWFFPGSSRNRILSYMMRYPRPEMHTFYNLKAADKWLDILEEKIKKDSEKNDSESKDSESK